MYQAVVTQPVAFILASVAMTGKARPAVGVTRR